MAFEITNSYTPPTLTGQEDDPLDFTFAHDMVTVGPDKFVLCYTYIDDSEIPDEYVIKLVPGKVSLGTGDITLGTEQEIRWPSPGGGTIPTPRPKLFSNGVQSFGVVYRRNDEDALVVTGGVIFYVNDTAGISLISSTTTIYYYGDPGGIRDFSVADHGNGRATVAFIPFTNSDNPVSGSPVYTGIYLTELQFAGTTVFASGETLTENNGIRIAFSASQDGVTALDETDVVLGWKNDESGDPDYLDQNIKIARRSSGYTFGSLSTALYAVGESGKICPLDDGTFLRTNSLDVAEVTYNTSTLAISSVGTDYTLLESNSSKALINVGKNLVIVGYSTSSGADLIAKARCISVSGGVATLNDTSTLYTYTDAAWYMSDVRVSYLNRGHFVMSFDLDESDGIFDGQYWTLDVKFSGGLADESYVMGMSTGNNYTYTTVWISGQFILQKWDLATMTVAEEFVLDESYISLTDVQNKTYVAYPFAVSDSRVYIFGRMPNPALLGLSHILYSSNGGSSVDALVNNWGSDYCGALVTNEYGTKVYAIRCSSSSSKLYKGTSTLLGLKTTLPYSGPTNVKALKLGDFEELIAASGAAGQSQTVVYLLDPYESVLDITYNHPQSNVKAVAIT